jgi:WD40 repeat protein
MFTVNIVKYAPYDSHLIFGMTDTSVLTFDIRREGLIVKDAHSLLYKVPDIVEGTNGEDGNSDELCELSSFDVHPAENLHLIAVGDDNGVVTIIDSVTGNVTRQLSRVHSNVVGAVTFQPNSRSYLSSGGFDSLFCCWDFSRGRPSGDVVDFSRDQVQQQQMANPPFVHDLLYKDGGKRVVAAVGDGTLRLMKYTPKQGFVTAYRKEDAHGGMSTCVCDYCPTAMAGQQCVLSAGIDCVVRGWKITDNNSSGGASGHQQTVSKSSSSKSNKKKGKNKIKQNHIITTDTSTSETVSEPHSFESLFTIDHKEKINAIGFVGDVEGEADSSASSGMVMVADVTSTWKLYKLHV